MIVGNQSLRGDPTISELQPTTCLDHPLVEKYYVGSRRCGRLSNTGFSVDPLNARLISHELLTKASIVNLHWVAGLLSPHEIAELATSERPLVWTMHDMRPITGGCHFSDRCEGYRENCSSCPQIRDDPCGLVSTQFETCLTTYGRLEWTAICPSEWLAACVRRSRIGQGRRVETISYGLDENVFRPREKYEVCAALNLQPDVAYLCVGAHWLSEKRKGVTYINQVLKMLANDEVFAKKIREGSWQLLSFGNDPDVVENSGWRVTSFSYVESEERLSQIFSVSNVLLFCSLADNLPKILIEACASGLPTVAMRAGGVKEIISDGENGFLVDQGKIDEAGRYCARLLQDKSLQKRMSESARTRACRLYALGRQADQYLRLYEDLLSSKARSHQKPFISLANGDPATSKESRRAQLLSHSLRGADEKVAQVQAAAADREKLLKQDITALWQETRGFSLRSSFVSALTNFLRRNPLR